MRRNASNSAYYQPIFAYLSCKYSIKTAFPIRLPNYSTGNYGIFSEKRLSISEIKCLLYLLHRRSLDTLFPITPWCVANHSMVCYQSLHGVLPITPWCVANRSMVCWVDHHGEPPDTACPSSHHHFTFPLSPHALLPTITWSSIRYGASLPSQKQAFLLQSHRCPHARAAHPLTGTFFLRTESY